MSVFPKKSKKPIKVLRGGGSADGYSGRRNPYYPNNESTNPFLSVGVDYISTDADIANVGAIDEYAKTQEFQRNKLEEARTAKEQTYAKLNEAVSKLDITSGAKKGVLAKMSAKLNEIKEAQGNDINYWLSRDGTNTAQELAAMTSADVIQKMRDQAVQIENDSKLALTNRTNDQIISENTPDGRRVKVVDEEGKHVWMAEDAYRKNIKDGNPIKAVTVKDELDNQKSEENLDNPYATSNTVHSDDATKRMEATLANANGSSKYFTKDNLFQIASNSQALAAATEQIKSTMSEQDKNAFWSDYSKSGSDVPFDKYMEEMVSLAAAKHKVYQTEVSAYGKAAADASAAKKALQEQNGGKSIISYKVNEPVTGHDSDVKYQVVLKSSAKLPVEGINEVDKGFGGAFIMADMHTLRNDVGANYFGGGQKEGKASKPFTADKATFKGVVGMEIIEGTYTLGKDKKFKLEKRNTETQLYSAKGQGADESSAKTEKDPDGNSYRYVKAGDKWLKVGIGSFKLYDAYKTGWFNDKSMQVAVKATAEESLKYLRNNYSGESLGSDVFKNKEEFNILNQSIYDNEQGTGEFPTILNATINGDTSKYPALGKENMIDFANHWNDHDQLLKNYKSSSTPANRQALEANAWYLQQRWKSIYESSLLMNLDDNTPWAKGEYTNPAGSGQY